MNIKDQSVPGIQGEIYPEDHQPDSSVDLDDRTLGNQLRRVLEQPKLHLLTPEEEEEAHQAAQYLNRLLLAAD